MSLVLSSFSFGCSCFFYYFFYFLFVCLFVWSVRLFCSRLVPSWQDSTSKFSSFHPPYSSSNSFFFWYFVLSQGFISLFCFIHFPVLLPPLQRRKFMNNGFGQCPRVSCNGQAVVPTSESDIPRVDKVKIFCPSCQQIYYPKSFRHGCGGGGYRTSTSLINDSNNCLVIYSQSLFSLFFFFLSICFAINDFLMQFLLNKIFFMYV